MDYIYDQTRDVHPNNDNKNIVLFQEGRSNKDLSIFVGILNHSICKIYKMKSYIVIYLIVTPLEWYAYILKTSFNVGSASQAVGQHWNDAGYISCKLDIYTSADDR